MRFALIDGSMIHQISDAVQDEPPFRVAAPLKWISCDDDVTTDHRYIDDVFTLEPFLAAAWVGLRNIRNNLLAACDWTQMSDAPLTDSQRTTWTTYRQALRDLPESASDPRDAVWPVPPA